MPDRRTVLAAGVTAALGGLLGACGAERRSGTEGRGGQEAAPGNGASLGARPAQPPAAPDEPPGAGTRELAGTDGALLHVPPGLPAGEPVPLVLSLHGAGGDAAAGLDLLRPLAEEHGLVLLAPSSESSTWDAVGGGFGPDVERIDRALEEVFATLPVDPGRIAVAGFSDGASYALGLGLANGGLFSHVVAFSPGFVPSAPRSGRPAVFVSHGVADEVLPIDRTSRRIVPALEDDGYDVTYREFDGPHTVPPDVAREAVEWLAAG
ncbi:MULTISPECIES: alpha/beta hydrolase [unclassified Blastococcus]